MNLHNKICLVTGGTLGIGAAAAIEFAGRGADVAIGSRHNDDSAIAVAAEITKLGRKCLIITGDVGLPADCARHVLETAEHFGKLDVLVHSAGGPAPGTIDTVAEDAWYEAFNVHVHAAFHLCRAAVPEMRKRSESAIILISSAAGLRGCPGALAYGTAKGAVIQFTRMLARDLANDNIRVNCVAPGVIRTRFHKAMTPEQMKNNLDNRIPLHREGTCEQVAQVIALLAENDFMTGETVTIDGGLTMRIA